MTTLQITPEVSATLTDSQPVGKRGVAIRSRLTEISEAVKALEAEKRALTAEFAGLAQGAKIATFAGAIVAKRIDSHSISTDYKTLLDGFPEAYAATVKQTPYSYYK